MSEVLGGQLGGIAVIQESDLNGLPPKHQDVGDAATQEVSVPLELLELLREEVCPVHQTRAYGQRFPACKIESTEIPWRGLGDSPQAVPPHFYGSRYFLSCTPWPPECSCCLWVSEGAGQRSKRHRQRQGPEADMGRMRSFSSRGLAQLLSPLCPSFFLLLHKGANPAASWGFVRVRTCKNRIAQRCPPLDPGCCFNCVSAT